MGFVPQQRPINARGDATGRVEKGIYEMAQGENDEREGILTYEGLSISLTVDFIIFQVGLQI
ncbi:MAG: hypothetical protein EHM27_15495 [Deltaproteobacteria bacterium]|nr:MAG: hypothetical protein EHM27_15495 [Deltaproteobacteria bacterium]